MRSLLRAVGWSLFVVGCCLTGWGVFVVGGDPSASMRDVFVPWALSGFVVWIVGGVLVAKADEQ